MLQNYVYLNLWRPLKKKTKNWFSRPIIANAGQKNTFNFH